MKITFCNFKGGVGKTSLSVLVAATLKDAGHDVGLFDIDPTGSATASAGGEVFAIPIGEHRAITIYDTRPVRGHPESEQAMRDADVCVLVAVLDPLALKTTLDTANWLSKHRKKRTVAVFNQVVKNTRLEKEIENVRAALPFAAIPNTVMRRECYKWAVANGWHELTQEAKNELLKVTLSLISG